MSTTPPNSGTNIKSSKRRFDEDDRKKEEEVKEEEERIKKDLFNKKRRDDFDCEEEEDQPQCEEEKCTHLWHAIRNVDIFSNIVERLNDTDKKLFASASRTSREILKQSFFCVDKEGEERDKWDELLKKTKLKISEVSSISTLNLAMEPCVKEYGEEFFLGKVAELDDLTFLRWAREEKGLKWDKWVSSAAAEQGNLEMLKYCFEHGCPLDDYTAICAAHNGHLRCLKFLIEDAKVDWCDQTACAAAEGGQLEILRYCASKKECRMTSNSNVMIFAAFGGHIECLNYLHQIGVPWSEEVPIYASQAGKIEILERIHELGCPLNEDACSEAALHGHLDLLKFLRNELKCPWDSGTPSPSFAARTQRGTGMVFSKRCSYLRSLCRQRLKKRSHRLFTIFTRTPRSSERTRRSLRSHVRAARVLKICTDERLPRRYNRTDEHLDGDGLNNILSIFFNYIFSSVNTCIITTTEKQTNLEDREVLVPHTCGILS